jgi:hypothetical protein
MDFKLILLTAMFSLFLVACSSELDSSLTTLEAGDCVKMPGSVSSGVESLKHVDCSEDGTLQVLRTFDINGYEQWPGDANVNRVADSGCPPRTNFVLSPTEVSWTQADDKEVICFE